jgi:hypothetical protein
MLPTPQHAQARRASTRCARCRRIGSGRTRSPRDRERRTRTGARVRSLFTTTRCRSELAVRRCAVDRVQVLLAVLAATGEPSCAANRRCQRGTDGPTARLTATALAIARAGGDLPGPSIVPIGAAVAKMPELRVARPTPGAAFSTISVDYMVVLQRVCDRNGSHPR